MMYVLNYVVQKLFMFSYCFLFINKDEEVENTAALRCDLCSTYFITPGEWVRHVQNTHTETELAMSNNSAKFGKKYPRSQQRPVDAQKSCSVCNKIFPSYASMVIHKRTHTGE